ncbi:hypothetical protein POM88_051619 [Heracleum sosnowskyi]|uniref:Uncharacterized protein n=1 Tax=Heracleum sosnowskyi TaxID=360622 RepID=A0AAD8H282_9APIA|nr:hypothetical protein POM88_051619 [Heracleum sosnowskyi]
MMKMSTRIMWCSSRKRKNKSNCYDDCDEDSSRLKRSKSNDDGFSLQRFPTAKSDESTVKKGDVLDLSQLLFTQDRDFLITYNDRTRPVQAKHLVDEKSLNHPSISNLLASPTRNYVIDKNKQAVPLRDLENKVVALYFFEDYPVDKIDPLTMEIHKVQNDGSTVQLSQLLGRKIILVVENTLLTASPMFWRKLIASKKKRA